MKKIEILYLSQEDVLSIRITMNEIIRIVEETLQDHALRKFENPPKSGVHPQNSFIHAMPGYLPHKKIAGLKWVSSFSGNHAFDIPSVMGLLILNDDRTGQPLAVMDCCWITAIRTGAVSAVASKFLARKDSSKVGIVGAGTQGRYNLLALVNVLEEIETVTVYDIDTKKMNSFAFTLSAKFPFKFELGANSKEVIENADIIVTATWRLKKPIFKEKWISPGALVLPVHHRGWENRTLHRVDKFITDDWRQLKKAHEHDGGFDGPLPKGYTELGEILIGKKPGRENEQERIIDFNYGLAIEDVAIAKEIFRIAQGKGIGTILPLIEGELPYA